jgi:hypothetical protein
MIVKKLEWCERDGWEGMLFASTPFGKEVTETYKILADGRWAGPGDYGYTDANDIAAAKNAAQADFAARVLACHETV